MARFLCCKVVPSDERHYLMIETDPHSSTSAREPVGVRGAFRIGFLYNHDALHQVAHTAPIISCLQRLAPLLRIDVLTSNDAQAKAVVAHLDPALSAPTFYSLTAYRLSRILEKVTGNIAPLGRIASIIANRKLLGEFDALIVPETTTSLLKSHFGMTKPKLIHMPHGAGDRSICVSPDIGYFDFVLLPGEKTRQRMLAAKVIREDTRSGDTHAIVGYPKFDSNRAEPESFFDNDKPVILYNPHFDPRLSSWFAYGEELLDIFSRQERFNIIFAPHMMLFRRKILASVEHRTIRFRRKLSERFKKFRHIHIDTGSLRSVDMSYTRAADIYVGDVSSQIYEFIETPRPALFLNSHGADWQGDASYAFWRFGPVIDRVENVLPTLERALPMDEHFRRIQLEAFEEAISVSSEHSAAERAAMAILDYLERSL